MFLKDNVSIIYNLYYLSLKSVKDEDNKKLVDCFGNIVINKNVKTRIIICYLSL